MFLVRSAEIRDLEDLYRLSKLVSFINLPSDKKFIKNLIQHSVKSFKGSIYDPRAARFLFVLEDLERKKIVGTSMILAQHGTPDEPHLYFSVLTKKKKSRFLKSAFHHQVLRLGFDYDGPTELGALLLDPEYRGHPERLGLLLSYIRFVYIAARRECFQEQLLVELMPPLEKNGASVLWEEIGKKFTSLDYMEADKLSRKNKEFITSLFPEGDIYTTFLSDKAKKSIGQVGEETVPAKKFLERLGFKYANMIDPFDGGPHFWAQTDKIPLIKNSRLVKVVSDERYSGRNYTKKFGMLMILDKGSVKALKGDVKFYTSSKVSEIDLFDSNAKVALSIDKKSECYFMEIEA